MADVLTEDGECLPEGEGLEGEDDFGAGAVGDVLDEGEVAAETGFFEEVVRSSHGG